MEMARQQDAAVADDFADGLVQFWTNSCNRFLAWQREYVIGRKPTPRILKMHRHHLALMLHLGRIVHAELADPDPTAVPAREMAGKIGQLEKSWQIVHNPLPDAEADAILKAAFPDERGTGTAG